MAEEIVRNQWITHKGVKMFHVDCRGVEKDALIGVIRANTAEFMSSVERGEKDILWVSDVTGVRLGGSVYSEVRKILIELGPHTKAQAVVGITGPLKALLKAVNVWLERPAKPFDNMEDAKDWLAEVGRE